jgi:hypothetical protein
MQLVGWYKCDVFKVKQVLKVLELIKRIFTKMIMFMNENKGICNILLLSHLGFVLITLFHSATAVQNMQQIYLL